MLKKAIIFSTFLCFISVAKGQNSFIPFQGIALDNQNKPLSQKTIGLKLSLLYGSSTGTLVYAERHTPNTDDFGLFQLNIGNGTALTSTFNTIDWSKPDYFVKVEMDLLGGTSYTVNTVTKLGYAPFAFFAQTTKNIAINGTNIALGNESMLSNTTGYLNVAIGQEAMRNAAPDVNNAIMIGERAGYVNAAQGNIGIGNYALNATTTGAYNIAIGTPSMERNTIGSRNTAVGQSTLIYNTTGTNNTALGQRAMASNTTGSDNVAVGTYSLDGNTTGDSNTAIGKWALQDNTTGSYNVAMGDRSLFNNNVGDKNTALGAAALNANTSGTSNVAIGANALQSNTAGSDNVAIGSNTLKSMTPGGSNAQGNTAIGTNALSLATSIRGNTAVGYGSMMNLNLGNDNTALGENTLSLQTNGDGNTAIGSGAMYNATNNATKSVAVGVRAGEKIAGGGNTFLGYEAGASNTGSHNVFIGYTASLDPSSVSVSNSVAIGSGSNVTSSNTVSLGNSSTEKWAFGIPSTTNGVFQVGSTTSNGNGAYLTAGGTWTNASSRAFKEDFQEIDDAELLSKINSLAITQWKYKNTDEYHIGPIAEDFKRAFNLGVVGDREHISTIDASGVALKGVQALYVLIDAQEKTISVQQKQIDELKALVSTLLKAKQ